LLERASAFAPNLPASPSTRVQKSGWILRESTKETTPDLTEPEERVYGLLQEIYESKLDFRVVVVGNGAILESTATLGPIMKVSQSPATGANLVTFASEDSSFEFHLMIAQVSKIAFVQKEIPTGRMMRILRFVNDVGKPVCSLILSDDSDPAAEWYNSITSKYGEEMQL
jgi:hypothetical protein